MNANIGLYFFLSGLIFCCIIYIYIAKKKSDKLDKELKIKKEIEKLSIYI